MYPALRWNECSRSYSLQFFFIKEEKRDSAEILFLLLPHFLPPPEVTTTLTISVSSYPSFKMFTTSAYTDCGSTYLLKKY